MCVCMHACMHACMCAQCEQAYYFALEMSVQSIQSLRQYFLKFSLRVEILWGISSGDSLYFIIYLLQFFFIQSRIKGQKNNNSSWLKYYPLGIEPK